MGTEFKPDMENHALKQFWGGDTRGVCLQITSTTSIDGEGFIQLTMEEAAALCANLEKFIKEEAMRRQALLREQIKDMQDMEKTVFREIADLSPNYIEINEIVVKFVSKFCPKVKRG